MIAAATHQSMAADQSEWLRKCAPWSVLTPADTVPTASATVSMMRAERGRPAAARPNESAKRENPPAACPAGKHWPAAAGLANQWAASAAEPP